jgi:hypothetical protein
MSDKKNWVFKLQILICLKPTFANVFLLQTVYSVYLGYCTRIIYLSDKCKNGGKEH